MRDDGARRVPGVRPRRPATLSPVLLGLLRRDLGFGGVVITDALDMKAISASVGHGEGAVRSLAAGADLLCIGNPGYPETYDADERLGVVVDAIVEAVERRRLGIDRLEEAAARVSALRDWLARSRQGPLADVDDVAARAVTRRGDVRVENPRVVDLGGAVNIAAGDRDRHLREALEAHAGTVASWCWPGTRASSPRSRTSSASTPTRSSCGPASTSTCPATTSCSPTAAAGPSRRRRPT